MQCNNWVNKNNKKFIGHGAAEQPKNSQRCGGEIVVTVDHWVRTSWMCGEQGCACDSELDFKVICDSCGRPVIHPDLPTQYNFQEWLTQKVKEL